MAKLVEAVPNGARLVLLGDPDQLPSVEAGDVLAGILAAADNVSADDSTSPASGRGRAKGAGEGALPSAGNTPSQASDAPAFPAHHIHLTRSYRHSASLNLAPLATAVRQGATTHAPPLLRTAHLPALPSHQNNPKQNTAGK